VLLRGIVHQNIEPTELLYCPLDHALAKRFGSQVSRQDETFLPFILNKPGRFAGVFVLVQICNGYLGPFAGKSHRHGTANSAIAAGDDRYPTSELSRGSIIIACGYRPGAHGLFETRSARLMLRGAVNSLGLGFGNHERRKP